jgi:hypothetical protein
VVCLSDCALRKLLRSLQDACSRRALKANTAEDRPVNFVPWHEGTRRFKPVALAAGCDEPASPMTAAETDPSPITTISTISALQITRDRLLPTNGICRSGGTTLDEGNPRPARERSRTGLLSGPEKFFGGLNRDQFESDSFCEVGWAARVPL